MEEIQFTQRMTNILRHFLPLNSQPFELLVSLQQLGACGPQVATHKGATGSETCIFCSKIKKGWSSVSTDRFIKGKLPFSSSLEEMKNDGITSLLFIGLFLTDGNDRRETKQT